MRKMISTALALAMSLACLASCGGNASTSTPASTPGASNTPAASTPATSEWPNRPVNVMCPAAAGGGTDIVLRMVNEYFTKDSGQPFVITNVTGISGYEQVHQGNTEGYDFICGTTTIFTSKDDGTLDYDWKDYEMVAFIEGDYSTCIAVQADSPYQTINDLFDAAAADPQSVTGGITLSGQPYMFARAMADAVDIDLYYVDCGNTSERNASLLGGQVDYIITNSTSAQAYVDSGDFRILAIDGKERNAMTPDVPTFIEQGVDFCFTAQPMVWLAPKGTPAEACEAFNAYLNDIYTNPDFVADFAAKAKQTARPIPSIEESIQMGQNYADTLAPYIK